MTVIGPDRPPSRLLVGGKSNRVWISDWALDQMHLPGGMVFDWTASQAEQAAAFARFEAPIRSGALKTGIRADAEFRPGRRKVGYFIRCSAPYAAYVHDGTADIFAAGMRVPKYWSITGAKVPRVTRDHVRGQNAQPFLQHGLEYALRDVL